MSVWGDSCGGIGQQRPAMGTETLAAAILGGINPSGGLAREEKVIFVLVLVGPILSVHFHRFHRKNIQGVETKVTGEPPLVP